MSIWHYIGGFLLFRWLFGNRDKSHNVGCSGPAYTTDYTPTRVDIEDYIANDLDEDLNNMHDSDYGCGYRQDSCSDYGGDQSQDDFFDEQDDYDMMDDNF